MREIKFRAWNFADKKMYSAEEMTIDQMAILPDGHFVNIHGGNTSKSIIYRHNQMLPLQFTGLLDKNDKEIYEGDIVIQQETSENLTVFWDEYNVSFQLRSDDVDGFSIGLVNHPEWYEVIGNIYENPELLK